MKNLKIGQNVLVKALVIDNDVNNLKLNIDKANGANETINYVDVDSVVNEYMTTKEFIDQLIDLNFDIETTFTLTDSESGTQKIKLDGVYIERDDITIAYISTQSTYAFKVLDVIDTLIDEDKLSMTDYVDLMRLIVKYTQTPIEMRG